MKLIYTTRETVCRLLFLFSLMLTFLAFCHFTQREADRLLPRGTEYAAEISFADLALASIEVPDLVLAGRRDYIGSVSTGTPGGETDEARIALVNRAYFEVQSIKLVKGGVPEDLWDVSLVLIGDDLARRLFLTLDCIGSQFTIDGQVVTVAGVYAESRSLLYRISGDGRELVFVLNGDMDSAADRVIVQTKDGERPGEEQFHALDTALNGRLRYSRAWDWAEKREELSQLVRLYVFISGIAGICLLSRMFILYLRRVLSRRQEAFAAGMRNPLAAAYDLIPLFICPLLCAALFLFVRFPLVIPGVWFPPGNRLLDLGHYTKTILNGVSAYNAAPYSQPESVLFHGVWTIHLLGTAACFTAFRLSTLLYRVVRSCSAKIIYCKTIKTC